MNSGFPQPPDDLELSPDIVEFINSAIRAGEFQVFRLSCPVCDYSVRRIERKGGGGTVYCPRDVEWALKRAPA